MTREDIRPWDRQPGETSKAYEAFSTYMNLGAQRSTNKTAQTLGKSKTLMDQWSAKWNWPERAAAWDSIPARAAEEAFAERAKRIAAQHDDLATALMKKLRRNVDLLPEGTDPSVRFSQALTAARGSHSFATDLTRPEDTVKEEISKQIGALIAKLAGDD